jgi:hypothetical protein
MNLCLADQSLAAIWPLIEPKLAERERPAKVTPEALAHVERKFAEAQSRRAMGQWKSNGR